MQRNKILNFFAKNDILTAFICLLVLISIITPSFLSANNILNLVRQVAVMGIVATGVTFVIIAGGIDLSVGSILGLSAVVATSFATNQHNYPLIVSIIIGILVGIGCGAFNGFIIAKFKIAPFIVTLAMTTIARGLCLVYTNGRPIIDLTEEYVQIGGGSIWGIPIPIYIFAIVIIFGIFLLHYTKFGRHVYAVGGNEQAAVVSGVNTSIVKFICYIISGVVSAIGGIVISSRIMTGQPILGTGYEMDAIASVIIGGTSLAGGIGTMFGTLIGVLLIGVIDNGLDLMNVSSYYQQIIKGAIILVAVLLDLRKTQKY